MRVRCPACKTVHDEPAGRFRCSGCGRQLAWHVPERWLPEQMTLFLPPGGAEPMTLPFATSSASGPPRQEAMPTEESPTAASAAGMAPEQRELLRDSIALVTALLPVAAGDNDIVPAILAEQDADRLLGLVATTAWLASVFVRQLDEVIPEAGTSFLQGMGLGLAE